MKYLEMAIKKLRPVCVILLLPILATVIFYDARRPYESYRLGRLLKLLKLV